MFLLASDVCLLELHIGRKTCSSKDFNNTQPPIRQWTSLTLANTSRILKPMIPLHIPLDVKALTRSMVSSSLYRDCLRRVPKYETKAQHLNFLDTILRRWWGNKFRWHYFFQNGQCQNRDYHHVSENRFGPRDRENDVTLTSEHPDLNATGNGARRNAMFLFGAAPTAFSSIYLHQWEFILVLYWKSTTSHMYGC